MKGMEPRQPYYGIRIPQNCWRPRPPAAGAAREHSLLVGTIGDTEAEAAEAKAAERTATLLRDSNPVICSAAKTTCCGRSSRTVPSCCYQWSHRSRGRRGQGRRAHGNPTTGFDSRNMLGGQDHLLRALLENTPFLLLPMKQPKSRAPMPMPPSARRPYCGIRIP